METKTHNRLKFSMIEILSHKRGYFVNNKGQMFTPNKNIVKTKNKQGYIKCTISVDGKNKILYAHRLMAYQLFGDQIYLEKKMVRHLDGNKENNRPENITIGSNHDNSMDRSVTDRINSAIRATKKTIKYDRDKVRAYYIGCGKSRKKTMKKFGITSGGTLHYILKNRKLNK